MEFTAELSITLVFTWPADDDLAGQLVWTDKSWYTMVFKPGNTTFLQLDETQKCHWVFHCNSSNLFKGTP